MSRLQTGPPVWACEICILAHGALSLLRQGGGTDCTSVRVELVKVFSTREDIDGAPREPGEGRQKEGRSGFLRATPNRFPGKTYLHTQDSATSYPSEPWHVFTEQMGNFFRAFLQKFQPIKLRSWALFRSLFLCVYSKLIKTQQTRAGMLDHMRIKQIIKMFLINTGEFMHSQKPRQESTAKGENCSKSPQKLN